MDAYIKKRIEKENKNATFPGFIDDTCQNRAGSLPGLLGAAAPPSVKLLKLPIYIFFFQTDRKSVV